MSVIETSTPTASAAAAAAPDAEEQRRPGRPRSERAEKAIISAALELFAEYGAEGLCIEKVAARAGVGKSTIYRRWPGKEDLLLVAMASLKVPLPEPRGRSVREDLKAVLAAMAEQSADPGRSREFALLLGEGVKYPRLMARYQDEVVEPRREVIRSILRRGVVTGELQEHTDVEAALFMLSGAVLTRGRFGEAPIEPGYAGRVVDCLMAGLTSR